MKTVVFDLETHGEELLFDMPPEEFVRLIGYWVTGEDHVITTDLEELRSVLRSADLIIGHNIHAFDLTATFGVDSTEPLEMALQGRVYDTFTHATLVKPHPEVMTSRVGRKYLLKKPDQALRWYSLDNLCFQMGLPGKVESLKDLAKEFGGFGEIPVDDPRFVSYLHGDLDASRQVARALTRIGSYKEPYAKREQIDAAINAQNQRNGWRVDKEKALARVKELDDLRDEYMKMLVEKHNMPTEGKAPLRSNAGKAAILSALETVGIKEKDLPRTKSGNGKASFGGEGLIEASKGKGDDAEELARAIAAIGGMRPLAQSALDNLHRDGKVHVQITTLQRSGRKSTTNPGLTVWTSRGKGAVEKEYFVPNSDDELLVAFDYQQADARIVAALSGDASFAQRFAPGVDAHLLTAWAVWGKDEVGTDKNDPKTAAYRNTAKAGGHAWSYRVGPRTMAKTLGIPLATARDLIETLNGMYRGVCLWQDKVTASAKKFGYVESYWGRRMQVERDREYTQASALWGQNGTRELMTDSLIRVAQRDVSIMKMLVAQVHDETVWSIPRSRLDEVKAVIKECMEVWWGPPTGECGQPVLFEVGCTHDGATNWRNCDH